VRLRKNAVKIDPKLISELAAQEPAIRRNQIEAMSGKAAEALNSATGLSESDPAWLWTLKIKGGSALDQTQIQRALVEAVKTNSSEWNLLKKINAPSEPLADADVNENITKAEWMLLEFWLAANNAPFFRSFCYYNDKALAKLVDHLLDHAQGHYSDKSVRKIWERLGLKKSTKLLFRDVEILPGKPAMPIPYKVIQSPA
jgi:hypothetical protein